MNAPGRGGARKNNAQAQDPRTAVHVWAVQKAKELVPAADTRTLGTILRAEHKTASAILHCNSDAQRVHTILAAYKRSGLPEPAELATMMTSSSPQPEAREASQEALEWLPKMMATLTQQTVLMTQFHELQAMVQTTAEGKEMQAALLLQLHQQAQQIGKDG